MEDGAGLSTIRSSQPKQKMLHIMHVSIYRYMLIIPMCAYMYSNPCVSRSCRLSLNLHVGPSHMAKDLVLKQRLRARSGRRI